MDIRLPLRYREVGVEEWTESATQNISRTGVLFQTSSLHVTGSLVQIDLTLPAVRPLQEPKGAQFVSLGRIVRTVMAGDDVALAVQFLEYQLTRRADTDS
jgi:hypothetical protein